MYTYIIYVNKSKRIQADFLKLHSLPHCYRETLSALISFSNLSAYFGQNLIDHLSKLVNTCKFPE